MKKIVIIGGVAVGATAAARIRRLDEDAEIIIIERGEFISYANCGLPYHVGNVIENRDSLFVIEKEDFSKRYKVDVRVFNEAIKIDRENKKVVVKDLKLNREYEENYDELILGMGASPFKPPIRGIDSSNVYGLWTVNDTDAVYIAANNAKKAVVVGGGFIGVELAENLKERGIDVSLIEMQEQVLAPYDKDISNLIENTLKDKGIKVFTSTALKEIQEDGKKVVLDSGDIIETDFVVLSLGTRPNTKIAKDAGIETNEKGFIKTNKKMQTNDKNIYAAGDGVIIENLVSTEMGNIALAGPANKQARIIGTNICGGDVKYIGSVGTSVIKVFDCTAARTGLNERELKALNKEYKKDYLLAIITASSNAKYYPGSEMMTLKLIFDLDGKVLGAQGFGEKGVEKRIDVIATALKFGATIYDLQEIDLSYAPPYSSAKDPVNQIAYVAENLLTKKSDGILNREISSTKDEYIILDIREKDETLVGSIENSLHIPLGDLRDNLEELDKNKKYLIYCTSGVRSYVAERILKQHGIKAYNFLGGYRYYSLSKTVENPSDEEKEGHRPSNNVDCGDKSSEITEINLSGLSCPGPIVGVSKAIENLKDGDVLRAVATDKGFVKDIEAWCKNTGNKLLDKGEEKGKYIAYISKGNKENIDIVNTVVNNNKEKTMIVFSGDLDKAIASFIIATGAAAMGNKVNMFFTFWGLNILKKQKKKKISKDFFSKMFEIMLPKSSKSLPLSKMNFMGMGPKMMRAIMENKNVTSLEDLIEQALESNIKITACQMSMDVMGIAKEELIDGVEVGGVAAMLNDNDNSNMNLFI